MSPERHKSYSLHVIGVIREQSRRVALPRRVRPEALHDDVTASNSERAWSRDRSVTRIVVDESLSHRSSSSFTADV